MKKVYLKKHLKFIVASLIFVFLFIFFFSFYNQKKTKAQGNLTICDTEIPIGESMDKTYELLVDLVEEHQKVYEAIPKQVEQARNKMANFAAECDTEKEVRNNCKPICFEVCAGPVCWCQSFSCRSVFWPLRTGFDGYNNACPTKDINDAWEEQKKFAFSEEEKEKEPSTTEAAAGKEVERETIIDGVIGSSANILALIKGKDFINKDGELDFLIPAKDRKGNGEINRIVEIDKTIKVDENIRLKDEPEDKKITLLEFIDRKLNRGREEFNNCALSPRDISALQIGEKMPEEALSAVIVAKEKYQLPERVKKECVELCKEGMAEKKCFECVYKSLLNYYCCH